METPNPIAYSTKATATGGRDGSARSEDGKLDITLAQPPELGGTGNGVNPEHLFAAGYSACFLGAMRFVAGQEKLTLSDDVTVTGTVGLGPIRDGAAFGITVSMNIVVPGMDKSTAQGLIDKADQVCPYSNATRGNIEVKLNLV